MPQHRLSQTPQVPIKEKIAQARKILEDLKIDAWITWVRETGTMRDPALDMIFGEGMLTWQSALIIPRAGIASGPIAIVGSYDVQKVREKGFYTEVIGHDQGPREILREIAVRLGLRKIALNFSENANIADGLTCGMKKLLMRYLERINVHIDFVSSEPILSQLRSVKTSAELELMRQAAKEMTDIYQAFVEIFTGERGGGRPKTEKEAAKIIQGLIERLGPDSYAWEPEMCPSVFTGPNTAEAHYPPSDRAIEPGHLLFLDCGVKVGGYCSDLQRTYYVRYVRGQHYDDEADRCASPDEVLLRTARDAFHVIHEAITKAAAAMKPGVCGWEIDAICRGHITSHGYPEYKHATGHGIGLLAHDGVAGIFPRWERYGNCPNIPLKEGEVFTLEPRISVPNMGIMTIEEMVVVTPEGGQFLSERQDALSCI